MVDYSNIPRDSRRVPLETRVQFKFDRFSGFLSEYSSNISPGGMFITTKTPLPSGQILDFAFRLGDGFELIKGRGEVVWTRTEDEGPLRPAGMGLRFLALSEGSKELIYRIVDQHILEGGTPFDVSLVPPDPVAPPMASMAPAASAPVLPDPEPEPPAPEPSEPSALDEPEPLPKKDDLDASSWLPALADLSEAPGDATTSRGPVFGSASAKQPRSLLPWAALAAVLILAAVGFLLRDQILGLVGMGGGEDVAQAAPPPAARPAEEPAPIPAAPGAESPAEPAAAETPVPETPAPDTGPALTALEKITWEEAFGGTDVILWGNGAIRAEGYSRSRIDGNPPRELIRIRGIERSFGTPRVVVGTGELLQVRTGYHPEQNKELHIVLDLAHPKVTVTRVEEGQGRLRIHLQRE
jgi:uncharacterized protein (TIGR02266 family)